MNVDDFDFDLPREFIAQRPAVPKDSARLLEVGRAADGDDGLRDHTVRDLPALLGAGDIVVFNDTRVIPARLQGRCGQARVEVTLHRRIYPAVWLAFARPARKLQLGSRVDFAPGFAAQVSAKGVDGEVTLTFNRAGGDLMAALERHGFMPLPPYIKRTGLADARDRQDYQTMFAEKDGAVAAPTAALHFTPGLMAALEARGVETAFLTLHVGAGTFAPVRVADTEDHRMHPESGEVPASTAEAVNAAAGRIVAVGSTVLRLLEAAAGEDGRLSPFAGDTDIFITPGYRFRIVDVLLTNFHLPRTTLFMLVSAFAGTARMKRAYEHAKRKGYRFYSYGDCCLLERTP